MENVIKILIADDHPLVREALRHELEKQRDFEVIAEASDGQMAVELAAELAPDIVIMDITMPKIDGVEATKLIKKQNPDKVGILVLTVHDDEEFMLNIIQAGADGYLIKSVSSKEVVHAIRALIDGEMVLSPPALRRIFEYSSERFQKKTTLPNSIYQLTPRESDILHLVALGSTNKEIALKLDLSLRTVKGYLLKLFNKLNARSRTEAIVIGLRNNLITIDDLGE